MSSAITLNSQDLERFADYLSRNPKVLLKHSLVAMQTSLKDLEQGMKDNAPSNEGTLRKGIRIDPSYTVFWGAVVPTAEHSLFVEEGTQPHWPPSYAGQSLDRWARAKGIPTFLVAKAIAEHGTKAQPFVEATIAELKHTVLKNYERALEAAANEIAKS